MALPAPVVAAAAASPVWGLWARPADHPGELALALAVLLGVMALIPRGPHWLASNLEFSGVGDLGRPRRFVTVAAFAAAFLSLAYVAFYLHGGPRGPDAAALWLQGRALSHGLVSWTAPDPTASFRAGPLLFTAPDRLAGTFAPGYPMLLAPAFRVGAPMLVGPLLGAATVLATWQLARELARARGDGTPVDAETAGRVAAGFSVVCAALRCETADATPGGMVALSIACSMLASLRARRLGRPKGFAAAGAAIGAALLASPPSSLAATLAALAVAASMGAAGRVAARWALLGALPGALLLAAMHRAAVGHGFASPAAVYRAAIALQTVPAGARGAALGALGAARAHLADVANFEPLALLLAVPLVGGTRSRATGIAGAVVALALVVEGWTHLAGGGSGQHVLGDALPIEHALLGTALVAVRPAGRPAAAMFSFALSLGGFAVHTSHAHLARAESDTGRPRYEPDVIREADVTHGLLFFDDDQGYELASDPGVVASHGLQAARLRGDDHDRLLYDLLGHPPAHRYVAAGASASVTVWTPPNGSSDSWRFEAEADWPPARVSGGRVEIVDCAGMCAADAKALAIEPRPGAEATMAIELPAPRGATPAGVRAWRVLPRVFIRGGAGEGTVTLLSDLDGPALAQWTWKDAANGPACVEIGEQIVTLAPDARRTWLVVAARGGPVALDRTTLRPR